MDRKTYALTILVSVYAGLLLISNFLAGVIWGFPISTDHLGQTVYFIQDGGILAFVPIYMLADAICEIYGRRIADQAASISCIICIIGFALCLIAAKFLPVIPGTNSEIYQQALGMSARILAASLIAFWFSAKCNNYIFEKIRAKSSEKSFWRRSLYSSYPAKILDSFIFNFIAFVDRSESFSVFLQQIAWATLIPCLIETVLNPLTKIVVFWLKRQISRE